MDANSGKGAIFARTIGVTGSAFVVNFFISFLLVPFVTDQLGASAYGFVAFSKTLVSYALIFTTALNSFAARFVAVTYHRGDWPEANAYYSSVFYGNVVLSICLAVLALPMIILVDSLMNVPQGLVSDVRLLFSLVVINFALTCYSVAFGTTAYVKNRLDLIGLAKLLGYVCEGVVLVLAFSFLSPKVWYVACGSIAFSAVVLAASVRVSRLCSPDLRVNRNDASFSKIKILLGNGIWNSANSLGNALNSGLDLLVANLSLGALAMGQLSIAKYFSVMFSGLYQLVAQPFQPLFLRSYAANDRSRLLSELRLSMKMSGMLSNVLLSATVGFGAAFYRLWLPGEDADLFYGLTVLCVSTGICEGAVYPLFYVYTLTMKNRVPSVVTILGGVLNVIGMLVLLELTDWGLFAIALTTGVIMNVINGVFNPLYVARCLNVAARELYGPLGRHLVAFGLMGGVGMLFDRFTAPESWLALVGVGCLFTLLVASIHFLVCFSAAEKKLVFRWFVRRFRRYD